MHVSNAKSAGRSPDWSVTRFGGGSPAYVMLGFVLLSGCVRTPSAEPLPKISEQAIPASGDVVSTATRRAILVSFDALNERRALESVSPDAIPTFRGMFTSAACGASARPAFPSVTAPGHAALWTGAYGNVSGVSANAQPRLPRSEHALSSYVSGYSAEALRAEPIWITAARAGKRVAGHHGTQAPQPPAYHGVDGAEPALDSAREAATRVLAQPDLLVMNGYNVQVAPSLLLTEKDATPRPATRWRELSALNSAVPPLEIAWLAGSDSVFALLHGGATYDRVLVASARDVARGTTAIAATEDTATLFGDRPLARHFAPPVAMESSRGLVPLSARLFSLSPDGQRFELLMPELRVVEMNDTAAARRYLDATGGWYGNGALSVYRSGRFGPTLMNGGDGRAEQRYVESLELLTRQFMRGSEWLWRTTRAELLLDYFPLIDEVDHEWYGLVDATTDTHDAALAARLAPYRAQAWALADRRLRGLRALVANDPNAALVVSGDHGMRSWWLGFRPNVVLATAGLLVLDSAGRVDLSRTKAWSTNGYYIMINRTAWKNGIVPPSEERAVLDAAEAALLGVRDAQGTQIVTRTWRADAAGADTLGIGGPTGGDLYYDVARGYYWNSAVSGDVTTRRPWAVATHGFPSTSPEMHTVLCVWGDGVMPRRIGPVRSSDAALVTSDWLGIPYPANAVGTSPYRALLGR